jgi:hypothetical protein
MTLLTRFLAAGAATAVLTGVASAQVFPIDYSHNWQPLAETVDVAFSGPGLFTLGGATPNFASPGDALRRCYGIDTTQGGRNQSEGNWESTNFRVAQGFGGTGGVNVGLVSVQAGAESDLGGDACFSPFLQSAGNTGGHKIGAAAIIGVINGTQPYPFPYVFDVVFQWVGTTTAGGVDPAFQGFGTSATNGTSGSSAGVPNPLLVNVIYEVQGPLNGGPQNNQYYLASTTEVTGTGNLAGGANTGTGGVTNGNTNWASSLTGVTADVSGAFSHSRILNDQGTAAFTGLLELNGFTGFQTPGLWAINDDNEGAGGPDWRISQAPLSVVNLRYQDNLSGGQGNTNVLFKAGISTGPFAIPSVANQTFGGPVGGLNFPIFIYSATPAATMPQSPLSWDDLGGGVPAQPGSVILGGFAVSRGGNAVGPIGGGPTIQTVPANFDLISSAFLAFSTLTFGSTIIGSDDIFLDGTLTAGGTVASTTSYFEGLFDNGYPGLVSNQNVISGTSGFSGGPVPVGGTAKPAAAGRRIGVAAAGLQITAAGGILITEVANALTIVLQ